MHNSNIRLLLEALAQGKLIDAIKLTREHTGLGLKEAKDLVEAAMAGCVKRAETLQGVPSADSDYGVFYVINDMDNQLWSHGTRREAEETAKARATADCSHTVVKAISRTTVKVEVRPV